MRYPRWLTASLFAVCLLAGCAGRRGSCPSLDSAQVLDRGPAPRLAVENLPVVAVEQAAFEIPDVPAATDLGQAGELAPIEYRRLGAEQVACTAAARSVTANLLESEQDATRVAEWCGDGQICSGPLERELLLLRAQEERNRAAGRALLLWYGLAEAETGRQALDASLTVLDRALKDLKLLRAQGVPTGADEPTLQLQRLDLLLQQEDSRQAIETLNSQLAAELGLTVSSATRFWPDVPLAVRAELPDLEPAIATGLTRRSELVLLRRLTVELNADTVAAARRALVSLDPSLGLAPNTSDSLRRWLQCACQSCEEPLRRRQLAALLAYREESVAAEIQQAWYDLAAALRRATVLGEKRATAAGQLADAERLRSTGGTTQWQIVSAELAVIHAEADLLRGILALRRAEVVFQQAQGQLAADCGYRAE